MSGRDVLDELERVLIERSQDAPAGSYSAGLLADPEKAARKVMEEAFEFSWEIGRPQVDSTRAASEAADLVFHIVTGLVGAGVALGDVWTELARRRDRPPRPAAAEERERLR